MLPVPEILKCFMTIICMIGSIFIYGNYRCQHPEFKDPLQKPLFDEKLPWLDGWAFTHFWAFLLIGLLTQNVSVFLPLSFGVGIAWEIFEHVVGKERPGWMGGYGGCNLATDKNEDGNWWYGNWTDLLMNGIGMILGIAFSMMLFK